MKKFTSCISIVFILALFGCKEGSESLGATSSSSSSNSTSSGAGMVAVTSGDYFSHINGDYPLLTNRRIDSLEVDFPVVASFFEIIKIGDPSELDDFIAREQSNGFDKEQYDIIDQAAIEVIQLLRNEFSVDFSGGEFVPTRIVSPFSSIPLVAVFFPGRKGKGKAFNYKLNGIARLPKCSAGDEFCNIQVDVDVTFRFPVGNPDFGINVNKITVNLTKMIIEVDTFKVSNALASLDLSASPKESIVLSFDHYWEQDDNGDDLFVKSYTGELPGLVLDLRGVFTNKVVDSSGEDGVFRISADVRGEVESFYFIANHNLHVSHQVKEILSPIESFEKVNRLTEPATMELGTLSGFMEGADLQVVFKQGVVSAENMRTGL